MLSTPLAVVALELSVANPPCRGVHSEGGVSAGEEMRTLCKVRGGQRTDRLIARRVGKLFFIMFKAATEICATAL